MNHLNELLKVIEIELRSGLKNFSIDTWIELTKLNDWDYRIVQAFITEVNLAMQQNNLNFIYKKYINESPIKNKIKFDIFIACLKRNQYDLVLTDVINRLVIPNGVSYKYFEVWGMPVDKARNFAVQEAFKFGCKNILFIDDDMICENTALVKLWETKNKTNRLVISANYQKKADYEITAHGNFIDTKYGDHIKETDLCAMGFTLINLDEISKKVPAPYFWTFAAPDGLWAMGEDAFFTQNIIHYLNEKPIVDLRPSILHYDKIWKRVFGNRNKSITYATNSIDDFTTFDHMRVPPKHPLVNICIPTRLENDPIATNLDRLLCLRGYKTELTRIFGLNVDEARNQLSTNSVKMGSEFILFIDNDIIFPENGLVKMLEVMEADTEYKIGMVSGDYLLKGRIPHSAHLQLNKEGLVVELNRIKDLPKELDSNWLVGMGCALVRTEVFRQLRYPYFLCMSVKLNREGVSLEDDGGVNEDAYFTEKLFENGYKVKILNDLKCVHVNFKEAKMYGYDKDFNINKYACFDWINKIQYFNESQIME